MWPLQGRRSRCSRCGARRTNNCEILLIIMAGCDECRTNIFLLPTALHYVQVAHIYSDVIILRTSYYILSYILKLNDFLFVCLFGVD